MNEQPPIRASDAEREQAVARVREAAGEGRLTLEELSERVTAALEAQTRADLEVVTAGLPADRPSREPEGKPTSWVVAIMGGEDRKGRWRLGSRCTVVNIMGGSDLDLRGALVEAGETEIRVFSLMGGSDIVVPEGVHVEMGGFAFMGGNQLRLDGPPAPPGAPVIRVRAYSLMGGTDVKERPSRRLHGGLR